MRRKFLLALVVALACACGGATVPATSTASASASASAERAVVQQLGGQIAALQRTTWHWQRLMGVPLAQTEGRVLTEMSIQHIKEAADLWQKRADAARTRAQHPPHLAAWLCIHRYEGSWTDPAPPYYGGLQMDIGFQRHYAPHLLRSKGTADHWAPLEQIWVAEKARSSGRGFYPWPNTARFCGLIS